MTLWATLALPLLIAAVCWLLIAPGLVLVAASGRVGAPDALPRALCWGLALSLLVFAGFFWRHRYGVYLGRVFLLAPPLLLARRPHLRRQLRAALTGNRDTWLPLLLMALLVLFQLATIAARIGGDDFLVGIGHKLLPHVLPSDNAISYWFAGKWLAHAPPRGLQEWSYAGSDRPPLQAAIYLALAEPLELLGVPLVGYQVLGSLLQAAWIPAVWYALRSQGASRRWLVLALGAIAASPLSYIHGLFVWPKLLGGALWLIGFAAVLGAGSPVLAGAAFALALLSHGTVAFALPALLVALPFAVRRRGWGWCVRLAAVAFSLYVPWLCYQRLFDPPGDALLREHLANDAPAGQSLLSALASAYAPLPWATIAWNKWQNVRWLGEQYAPLKFLQTPSMADLRTREFLYVANQFGLLLPLALLLLWRRERPAGLYLGAAALALLFCCAALFKPNVTATHVGPYGAYLLGFMATTGALAVLPRRAGIAVFAVYLAGFLAPWVLDGLVPDHPGTWLGLAAFAGFYGCLAALSRVSTRSRSGIAPIDSSCLAASCPQAPDTSSPLL